MHACKIRIYVYLYVCICRIRGGEREGALGKVLHSQTKNIGYIYIYTKHAGRRCCRDRLIYIGYIYITSTYTHTHTHTHNTHTHTRKGTRDAGAAETSTKDTNITYIKIHGRRHNTAPNVSAYCC